MELIQDNPYKSIGYLLLENLKGREVMLMKENKKSMQYNGDQPSSAKADGRAWIQTG